MDLTEVNQTVREILDSVAKTGDEAVLRYTECFDRASLVPEELQVEPYRIEAALATIDPALRSSLEAAAENIRGFHEAQMAGLTDVELDDGAGRRTALIGRPLAAVGLYVPGGTAPLPSSVLMNAIPAKVAGVERLILCTPPQADGTIADVILAAAAIAGVDEVYRVGGAQAIGAMAYGTKTIPGVDKIVGPGNIYVNAAKRQVFGTVDIDMFAGPSEILILADLEAPADYVAADLLSQAEHDRLASAIAIVRSREQAEAIRTAALKRAARSSRAEILAASLRDYAAILVVDTVEEQIELANELAPEHLELCMADESALRLLPQIESAGAVFIGYHSPEPLGDYWAGTNHVLPTSGTARFFSPLNCADFRKKISVIRYSREALEMDAEHILRLAESEGLDCHAAAIQVRLEEKIDG